MAAELGKAYVQIYAKAEGLGSSVHKMMNKEAGDIGNSAGSSFGGSFVSTIKKMVVAAGIGKMVSESINIGAALEQSLGGVEAIFGDAADLVKKNAQQAFATAGVSANEYMEGVTSFAASLLQSTGGNAVEAANVADMAFRDMSDNANRFGTDIGSIQTAYQGFAKQNYTMLDNLKLGYGGTKTEMERLLADAEKLSGIKYDISNLDDVYEAIHVIQGELNVTGTTAAEAASTFSGSLAMMKAAGKNLLGSLTLGQDIQPALKDLLKSVEAFAGNALRLVGNIIKGLPELITSALKEIPSKLRSIVPEIIEALFGKKELSEAVGKKAFEAEVMVKDALGFVTSGGIVQGLLDFIQELLGTMDSFVGAGLQLINGLIAGLKGAIPNLVSSVGEIITHVGELIINSAPQLLESAITMASTFLTELVPAAIDMLISTGFDLIHGLITGILDALPDLLTGITEIITNTITAITDRLPEFLNSGTALLQSLLEGIMETLPDLIDGALTLVTQFLDAIIENLPEILDAGINMVMSLLNGIIDNLPKIAEAALKGIIGFIAAIGAKLPMIIETGITIIGKLAIGLIQAIPKIVAAIPKIIRVAVDQFKSFDWLGLGRSIIEGIVKGIKNVGYLIADTLKGIASRAWQGVKNFLGIGSPSRLFADKIGQWIPAGIAMGIDNNADTITDAMDDISNLATGTLTSEMVLAANAQAAQIGVPSQGAGNTLEASLLTIIELLRAGKVININGERMAAALAYDMDAALGDVAVRKGRG